MIAKVDLVLSEGLTLLTYAGFVGASIILVAREGRVYTDITGEGGLFTGRPEFVFRTNNIFKWKILFNAAAGSGGEKVSVIYKL